MTTLGTPKLLTSSVVEYIPFEDVYFNVPLLENEYTVVVNNPNNFGCVFSNLNVLIS